MIQQFVDRKEELDFLLQRLDSGSAEFILLYGRRRVGKTEIIKRFIKEKKAVYFLADRRPEIDNIRELQKKMAGVLNESLFEKADFKNFVEVFEEFAARAGNQRTVVVIDEFSYLMEGNKAATSIFQKIWDEYLAKTKLFLIICGSSISMMEKLMGRKNPLYGRRTGQWKVELLKFRDARKFFPGYALTEQIKAFSILDGIPAYLLQFDDRKDLMENIREKILNKGSILYGEPEFLLREELREPRNYFSILKSISFGNTAFGEIVNHTQLDKTLVSKYLNTLLSLHFIERACPVTSRKEKARDTIYRIYDNFFDFWFRFVYPNKGSIEEGKSEAIEKIIKDEFNSFVGRKFERICKEFLINQCEKSFVIQKIGTWWHKGEEIDIVALNDQTKQILFCECKWREKVDAARVLAELKEKAKFVEWNNDKRREHYAIFAKSFRERIKEPGLLLFDLNDLERALK